MGLPLSTCQTYIKNSKNQTVVKLTVVPCAPVVEVKIKRPDTKYQLGFSVQNGVVSLYLHFFSFLFCFLPAVECHNLSPDSRSLQPEKFRSCDVSINCFTNWYRNSIQFQRPTQNKIFLMSCSSAAVCNLVATG